MLSQIGWVLLHCDHSSGLDEGILWVLLWGIQCDSLVGIEALCEIISINDSEHSAVDVEVDSNVKVSPLVGLGFLPWDEHLMTLQENALGDSSVLNSVLKDMQCVVIKVIVDGALADTVVLVGVFNNWLLEESVEVEHLLNETGIYI